MKKLTNKIKIFGFDILSAYQRDLKSVDNKEILIVYGGVIGDSVLFCDALRGIREIYPEEVYKITIVSPKSAAFIFGKYTKNITTIGVDFGKLNTDFQYHKKILSVLKKKEYEIAINPFLVHANESDSIMIHIKARNKIQFLNSDTQKLDFLQSLINKKCGYIHLIDNSQMELIQNAEVVRKLGNASFKARIPQLIDYTHSEETIDFSGYIVMAIGASTPCKRWPAQRFAEIASILNHKFQKKIVLCGGQEEKFIYEEMRPYLQQGIDLINMIGKTTLSQLVGLIRKSELVIGNDSSSVHIAAATNTPAICIVGGWDYGRMYPYKVESGEANMLPHNITVHMECFNCARVKTNNQIYPCIDAITSDKVLNVACGLLTKDRS